MEALLKIDRRIIYILVFLALVVTTKIGFDVPIEASGTVKDVYQAVETLTTDRPDRDRPVVLVSMDFDPPSAPELGPITRSMLRQMLRKGHKVVGMTHWPSGLALTKSYMLESAAEFDDVLVGYHKAESKAAAMEMVRTRQEALEGLRVRLAEDFDGASLLGDGREAEAEEAAARAIAEALGGSTERAMHAAEGRRRLGPQRERWRQLPPEGRAALLLDAVAQFEGPVAVFSPGRAQITAQSGPFPTWENGMHAAVARTLPFTAVAADLGVHGWAVLEVLARVPTLLYGTDYCFLGMKPGQEILIVSMGQSIYDSFPADADGNLTRAMPILRDVPTLKDIDYMVALAAGDTGEKWIQYGHEKLKFPMSVGCTAVMAPDLYPYRQAKQIDGIVGGIRGAWEYEKLVGIAAEATSKVPPQTAAHLLIILLIVVCNVGYLLSPRGSKR